MERHLVFWPCGGQRPGLDVELGFLLAKLGEGVRLDVRVLVEVGTQVAGRLVGGGFEPMEIGKRTHYYEDLVSYGYPIVEWEDYEALFNAVLRHGPHEF